MRGVRRQQGETGASRVSLTLPVSDVRVGLRPMTGEAEALLAESRPEDPALTIALLERLGEAPVAWHALPVHDIDVLMVRLRQVLAGDRVVAEVSCGGAGCGQRVDMSFNLGGYVAHHRPRPAHGRGWTVSPSPDAPGWHRIEADGIETTLFRPPTLSDQIAVAGASDEAAMLAARCIRPEGLRGRVRRRVEAAMEAMAPPLARSLQGHCPDCGAAIEAWFDARLYCLQDLCARARFVFEDIDLLAERYHWSEREILRLPRARREFYAERARAARAA